MFRFKFVSGLGLIQQCIATIASLDQMLTNMENNYCARYGKKAINNIQHLWQTALYRLLKLVRGVDDAQTMLSGSFTGTKEEESAQGLSGRRFSNEVGPWGM